MRHTFEWNGKTYSTLSFTTGMECWSFSLAPVASCAGRKTCKGSICNSCYGQLGRYACHNVMDTLSARFAYAKRSSKTKQGRKAWVDNMVLAINTQVETGGRFRWFDNGDMFNKTFVAMVGEVCRRTPTVRHWIPTRTWWRPWVKALVELNTLPNVCVRPSAIRFNDPPPAVEGLGPGLASHTENTENCVAQIECPKAKKGNNAKSCKQAGCTACWDGVASVSFLAHGHFGRHTPATIPENNIKRLKASVKQQLSFVPLS